MKVIFQNKDVIVVDKNAGVLTTPPRFRDERPVLGLQIQKKLDRQIFPVHRLDFEVSGIVLFALSERAHRDFNRQFEQRKVTKIYQAFAAVTTSEKFEFNERLEWKSRILRGKKRSYESPAGLDSLTYAQKIKQIEHSEWGQVAAWELAPRTGRPHQLRFEMYKNGVSILNDTLYGGSSVPSKAHEIALKAVHLEFEDEAFCSYWKVPAVMRTETSLF